MKKEIAVTFSLFIIEAMIHYNIGLRSNKENKVEGIKFPKMKELFSIIITVFIFSSLSGFISSQLKK